MILRIFQVIAFLTTTTTCTAFIVGTPRSSTSAGPAATSTRREVVVLGASSKKYDDCDVAIMGGGFGGLYTALAISREAKKKGRDVDVALVDPSDRFVFLPLLYDLAMGTASEGEVCPTYKELLEGTGVRYIKASFDGFSKSADDAPSEAVLTTVSEQKYNREKDDDDDDDIISLSFQASVVAVGATPQSILASIPGAAEYAQPFYTKDDAYATRELLFRMDQKIRQGDSPRIAVVGGGFGGVEMAACVARRLPKACVTLMSRGPPMAGTRAEPLVDQALKKLGVHCEMNSVDEIKKESNNRFTIQRRSNLIDSELETETPRDDDDQWDAVLWTAGSGPAYPVTNDMGGELALSSSGRLMVDNTLRCCFNTNKPNVAGSSSSESKSQSKSKTLPSVWALGDCSEIVPALEPATPKTAQAAMQQADVVASNVLAKLASNREEIDAKYKVFEFLDLGSMLTLGGPNAAVLGPKEDSQIGSLLVPLLDTARIGLSVADTIFAGILNSPQIADKTGDLENLGLSLGGYGLGVDPEATPGTISGTLSGAGRRAIYALRMPTNKQRAYAGASAFISTAAALAKEASNQIQSNSSDEKQQKR